MKHSQFGRVGACRQQEVDSERRTVTEPFLHKRAENPEPVQVEDQVDGSDVKQGQGQQPPRLVQTVPGTAQNMGSMFRPPDDCSDARTANRAMSTVIGYRRNSLGDGGVRISLRCPASIRALRHGEHELVGSCRGGP